MNKKRLLAGLTSLVMALTALSGCGEPKQTNTGNEEIPTLTYYWPAGVSDTNIKGVQDELNEYLKEKLNCQVELHALSQAEFKERSPLMLSTGEEVDLMFSASWLNYLMLAGQNSFTELSDLLNKYGQGIKDCLQEDYLKAPLVNGKLYGIPSNKDIAQGYGLFMDKETLDAAGVKIEDIKTLEDIEPILKYLKENKPGMSPLPKTLESGNVWLSTKAALEEGYSDHSKLETGFDGWGGLIAFDKAKDEFVLISPENSNVFVAAVELMHDWYKKGYFSEDIIADTTTDDAQTLWKEGKSWYYVSSNTPGRLESIEKRVEKEVVLATLRPEIANTDSMIGSLTTIPRSSKNPELAMQFLNLIYTDEKVSNLLAHGQEGVNYIKVDDDVIEAVKVGDFAWPHGNNWYLGDNFNQYIMNTQIPDYKEQLMAYNNAAPRSELIGFSFDSSNMKNEVAAINNVYSQYKKIFFTGAGTPEKDIKDFFSKIEQAGINEVVKEYNKQYQAWKANK